MSTKTKTHIRGGRFNGFTLCNLVIGSGYRQGVEAERPETATCVRCRGLYAMTGGAQATAVPNRVDQEKAMSTEFYRKVRRAGSQAVRHVEREQAIRLYCEMSGESWILQVRGPEWIGSGWTEGKKFQVSTAHLNKADLEGLRQAIDVLLVEAEQV